MHSVRLQLAVGGAAHGPKVGSVLRPRRGHQNPHRLRGAGGGTRHTARESWPGGVVGVCSWGPSPAVGGTTAPSAVTSPPGGSSARGDRDPVRWVGGSEPPEWPCLRRGALALALGPDLHRRKRGSRGDWGKGGAHAPPRTPGQPMGDFCSSAPRLPGGVLKVQPSAPPQPRGTSS